jgi:hypothetical protein
MCMCFRQAGKYSFVTNPRTNKSFDSRMARAGVIVWEDAAKSGKLHRVRIASGWWPVELVASRGTMESRRPVGTGLFTND